MIKILSANQTREADRYTIEHEPISSIDLMERAAQCFVNLFTEKFSSSSPIYIFCGYGNNGGDGLAIARMLIEKNFTVAVFILADKKKYSEDFLINEKRLLELREDAIQYLEKQKDFPAIPKSSVIIDALFGSGLNKPLKGFAGALVKYLDKQEAIRVAVDIPSGLFADKFTGGTIIKAHHTITFSQPKLSFLFPETYEFTGEWTTADIGLDKNFISSLPCSDFFIRREDIKKIIRPRKKFDHKGTFGHAFIYAGNVGKMGAAILCAKACIRSGSGLTTVYLPKDQSVTLNIAIPEAMTEEYGTGKKKTAAELSKYSCFALGPGIGTGAPSKKILLNLLKEIKTPAVFDADALTILSQEKKGLRLLPKNSIITPHPREFERLAGRTSNWYERHQLQIKLSKKNSIYIVLKGAYTCISTPDGNCYFNSTGNPGMAKGGSGDVLTGMITAFLAQKYSPEESCLLGVYLHGLAADIAVKKESGISMVASDIIAAIGSAFNEISDHKEIKA